MTRRITPPANSPPRAGRAGLDQIRAAADPSRASDMNVSGFVVTALPAHLGAVAERLAALPLTEVTGIDEACGRLAVVQERATVGEAIDGLLTIQRLPHVISADLFAHYLARDRPPVPRRISRSR